MSHRRAKDSTRGEAVDRAQRGFATLGLTEMGSVRVVLLSQTGGVLRGHGAGKESRLFSQCAVNDRRGNFLVCCCPRYLHSKLVSKSRCTVTKILTAGL